MDHQYSHLVIYNTTHHNVLDVIKYFKMLTIAKINIIKFINHKDKTNGNIHISIEKWYDNHIAESFYNNLLDPINVTKIVYDDPKYFEIEFDNFNHEYSLCEHANYNYNVYNLDKSNNLKEDLERDTTTNNEDLQQDTTTNNEDLQQDNTTSNQNIIVSDNVFSDNHSEISSSTDFNDFVKYEEFFELSNEVSSQIDNLNNLVKFQFKEIKTLKKKLECSIMRINYLESDIIKNNPKHRWKNRLRSRHSLNCNKY
tara:strand:- start:3283 stop:4047 length:765 start_codon:yes stop_codon:yes gene_type:complete